MPPHLLINIRPFAHAVNFSHNNHKLFLPYIALTDGSLLWSRSLTSVIHEINIPVNLHEYHSGDQVKKTEMGRTCGAYGGEERCIQGFSGKT